MGGVNPTDLKVSSDKRHSERVERREHGGGDRHPGEFVGEVSGMFYAGEDEVVNGDG